MTLKEKFQDVQIEKGMSDRLEQIAEDFAIGFAKWNRRNAHIYGLSIYSYKKLLEIYKKEKGL